MNAFDPLLLAVVFVLVGSLLAIAEVLFPSGGMLGFFSATSFGVSIYYAFQSGGASTGVPFAAGVAIIVPLLLLGAFKVLPHTAIGKAVLGEAPKEEDVATDDPRRTLLGKVGVARSKMLPAGAVEIEGAMIDAVSQGQAIDPGQYVKVVEVRGNRVVVRLAPTGSRPKNEDPSDLLTRPIDELGIESLDDPLA